MSATVLQHGRSPFVLDPRPPFVAQASTPGIAAPKLYVCSHCRISLVVRARPLCFACGQPMKLGK